MYLIKIIDGSRFDVTIGRAEKTRGIFRATVWEKARRHEPNGEGIVERRQYATKQAAVKFAKAFLMEHDITEETSEQLQF